MYGKQLEKEEETSDQQCIADAFRVFDLDGNGCAPAASSSGAAHAAHHRRSKRGLVRFRFTPVLPLQYYLDLVKYLCARAVRVVVTWLLHADILPKTNSPE